MLTEVHMMENGAKTNVTAEGFTNMLMEVHMMENGAKTKSTAEGS